MKQTFRSSTLFVYFSSLLCIASAAYSASVNAVESLSGYRLGTGDNIAISVYGEEDLSLEFVLSDAGTISYPFLGELMVRNLTVSQLEDKIVYGLKGDYLIDPKVNVKILSYREMYIYGEVQNSGSYSYQPGLTLRKAITIAGGFTERASKSKIYVIREKDSAQAQQLIRLGDPVYPGDTITVEQSFF